MKHNYVKYIIMLTTTQMVVWLMIGSVKHLTDYHLTNIIFDKLFDLHMCKNHITGIYHNKKIHRQSISITDREVSLQIVHHKAGSVSNEIPDFSH